MQLGATMAVAVATNHCLPSSWIMIQCHAFRGQQHTEVTTTHQSYLKVPSSGAVSNWPICWIVANIAEIYLLLVTVGYCYLLLLINHGFSCTKTNQPIKQPRLHHVAAPHRPFRSPWRRAPRKTRAQRGSVSIRLAGLMVDRWSIGDG